MPKLSDQAKRRQEIMDHLVGNCDCENQPQFTEDDFGVLNKFSVEQLEKLFDKEEKKEEPAVNETKETPVTEKQEPVENKQEPVKEPVKFDESMLPENVREELQFARNMLQQKKDQLIAKITTNKDCMFTKEELNKKSPDELTKIASLVGNSEPVKEEEKRQTPRLGGHNTPVGNTKKFDASDLLDLPVMNFGSNK
jgi:hypothetical protein